MLYHLPLQNLLSSPLLDWTHPQFLRDISESCVIWSTVTLLTPLLPCTKTCLIHHIHHSSFFLSLRKFSFADLFTQGNTRSTCRLGKGICRKQEKLNWDILTGMVKNFLQRRQSIVSCLCPLLTTPKKVTISWRDCESRFQVGWPIPALALPITVWPRASYFHSLCLKFLVLKMEVTTTRTLLSYDEDC